MHGSYSSIDHPDGLYIPLPHYIHLSLFSLSLTEVHPDDAGKAA
jgi:hypothetical protein